MTTSPYPAPLALTAEAEAYRHIHADNASDWPEAHRGPHEYLCGLCRQPRLLRQIAGLHSMIEPYMRLWFNALAKPLGARAGHLDLLGALRTRDPDAADAAMRHHVRATVPELMQFLASRPPSSPP